MCIYVNVFVRREVLQAYLAATGEAVVEEKAAIVIALDEDAEGECPICFETIASIKARKQ